MHISPSSSISQPGTVGFAPRSASKTSLTRSKRIWIDLDNTPHVPFFKPILRELERRGHQLLVTGRGALQVSELAAHLGLRVKMVGKHCGRNTVMKVMGLGWRSLQLSPAISRFRPHLAVSHGSRSQLLLSRLLRIPSLLIDDYEHSEYACLTPDWLLTPSIIPNEVLPCSPARIRKYSGLKEEVYIHDFKPNPAILSELGLSSSNIIVTVRPPATDAFYRNAESDVLFTTFMDWACGNPKVQIVLLPRNGKQTATLLKLYPTWFKGHNTVIPPLAVDGLNLLWHSDLVVSGGGTMNREAAVLGVPVYGIFRGPAAAVDRRLHEEGRLVLIESVEDLARRIVFRPRDKSALALPRPSTVLSDIVNEIESILASFAPIGNSGGSVNGVIAVAPDSSC